MDGIGGTQPQLEWEWESEGPGYELEQSESFTSPTGELELPLHETQELELASELLEVSSEGELEQFLSNVFRTVGSAVGRFARSDAGKALREMLKDAARRALPTTGVGTAPGAGAATGGPLAQQAGALLGLELEGLSPQEQEFEAARQFTRLAGAAYRRAALAPRGRWPRPTARRAAIASARRYAPGLVSLFAPRPDARYGYGYYTRPRYPRRRRRYPRAYRYPPAYYESPPDEPPPDEPPPYEPPPYEPPAPPAPGLDGAPEGGPEPPAPPDVAAEPGGSQAPASQELGELAGTVSPWARGMGHPSGRSGRWVRRGRHVVVYGA